MPHSEIRFRDTARQALLAGASTLADAVRPTLGPKSKCVLLGRKWGTPLVCNDGVTIAKEVRLEDPAQDLGAQVLKTAAVRTGDAVGDGTTTSTLLAHAIFSEGVRNVVAGASAIELKRGIDRGARAAVARLRELSRPVASGKDKAQVAAVAAHNDEAIGRMVAEAMDKVGDEGVVSVEEAKGTETVLEVVEGMKFDRGFLSPYFVTKPERMVAELEDPLVLLHEKRITGLGEIVPLLQRVAEAGRSLLIVAEDVEAEALATLVVNKLRGTLPCVAVKAPGFGDRRKAMLQDLEVLTGAVLVADELGRKLATLGLEDLGRVRRVVVDKESTTLIGGGGEKKAIEARCRDLRAELERATSDYDREKLQERLARLSGGVAVVKVGAPSEAELKNRKEAFEDAIAATKAAVAEGLLPGGGLALIRCGEAVAREEAACAGDERVGVKVLERALEAPARQIAENSGADDGVVVQALRAGAGNLGFDAARNEYVDLMEAGIIDATKVVRLALENAVSAAGTLLLAEATLTEVEDEKERKRATGGPGGMDLD